MKNIAKMATNEKYLNHKILDFEVLNFFIDFLKCAFWVSHSMLQYFCHDPIFDLGPRLQRQRQNQIKTKDKNSINLTKKKKIKKHQNQIQL